jgi:hypothetical protein
MLHCFITVHSAVKRSLMMTHFIGIKMADSFVVVRIFATTTGKPRAISAGPFSSRGRAMTYMRKFLREQWYLPRSEFYIAPLRAEETELRTWHES